MDESSGQTLYFRLESYLHIYVLTTDKTDWCSQLQAPDDLLRLMSPHRVCELRWWLGGESCSRKCLHGHGHTTKRGIDRPLWNDSQWRQSGARKDTVFLLVRQFRARFLTLKSLGSWGLVPDAQKSWFLRLKAKRNNEGRRGIYWQIRLSPK